ncbi:MAG: hypothetical protein AAF628_35070 [Planctomycetota bacterium]
MGAFQNDCIYLPGPHEVAVGVTDSQLELDWEGPAAAGARVGLLIAAGTTTGAPVDCFGSFELEPSAGIAFALDPFGALGPGLELAPAGPIGRARQRLSLPVSTSFQFAVQGLVTQPGGTCPLLLTSAFSVTR